MRVLIVEDNSAKASSLASAVEAAGASEEEVVIVPDSVAARERLSAEQYDILILDLQIPRRFGDGPDPVGGVELLRSFTRRSKPLPPHVLAATSYALEGETAALLQSLGVAVLECRPGDVSWQTFIQGLVRRISASARPLPVVQASRPPYAVVLTTVPVEYDGAKRVFDVAGNGEIRAGVMWHRATLDTRQGRREVVLAMAAQMGMPAAAVLTSKAIRLWNPQLLVLCGICAGVRGETALGDLVIPDPCWDYGSGKLGTDGILKPDPRSVELREGVRALVYSGAESAPLTIWRDKWPGSKPPTVPSVLTRPAASGSAVLADGGTVLEVKAHSRKLVGIDMENYGFYYACANSGQEPGPRFCGVKGVVDFADDGKNDKYQEYASYLSAAFARWLIEQA